MKIRGMAVPFDTPTVIGIDGIVYIESVSPHAFDNPNDMTDVRILVGHDETKNAIARYKKDGTSTAKFWAEADGLYFEADIVDYSVYQSIKRGDVNGVSIGFRLNPEEDTLWDLKSEPPVCYILRAHLKEISIVNFPAYPTAYVEAVE